MKIRAVQKVFIDKNPEGKELLDYHCWTVEYWSEGYSEWREIPVIYQKFYNDGSDTVEIKKSEYEQLVFDGLLKDARAIYTPRAVISDREDVHK